MKTLSDIVTVIGILLVSFNAFAQKPPVKLGDVSRQEIEMKTYEPDPDADAVVICDYGYLNFNFNLNDGRWENQLKRTCRIKIFNDDGYKWATEQISLYDDNNTEQSISQIKGFTHNLENGKVIKSKLSKENIFHERTSKNYNRVKFTLPNVKEGSVIEFSYVINSNYLTILDKWEFQKSIPVKWSEYIVNIPEYLTYLKNSQGYEPFYKFETGSKSKTIRWTESQRPDFSGLRQTQGASISQHKFDYTDNIFHWIARDLPGLQDEAFVGNYRNYLLSVDFQLSNYQTFSRENKPVLRDWKSVVDKFVSTYEDFGPNMKKRTFYKDITNRIMSEYEDPIKRTVAVYNFVSEHMKWDKKERFMPSHNIKKAFEERTGTSADINALLVSMLRAVEIDADPVIISTVDNGLVHPVYPIIDKYNYLIARVIIGDKSMLLDATEKDIPFGLLPFRCLNHRGYAISENNPGWVDLQPVKGMEKTVMCMLTLDEKGQMKGTINCKADGYSALSIRKRINQDGEEKYIENVKSTHPDWTIEKVDIDATENISGPVKETIECEITGVAEMMGNMVYIQPIISDKIEENPLKQEERKFPIEFVVPMKNSYMFNLTIPDGYVVDELPESINLVTPDRSANFKYIAQVLGNRLQLVHSWQINESFYPPEKFTDLKEFYSMLTAKQNEQIVLKKAEPN